MPPEGRATERRTKIHKENLPWFTPQMATAAKTELGWNQEPGIPLRSPTYRYRGTSIWVIFHSFPGTLVGSLIKNGETRIGTTVQKRCQHCRHQLNVLHSNTGLSTGSFLHRPTSKSGKQPGKQLHNRVSGRHPNRYIAKLYQFWVCQLPWHQLL